MFYYMPVYDDTGVRLPRYSFEGLNGLAGLGSMGAADQSLLPLLVSIRDQANEVRDLVRGLGMMIQHDEATEADVDRVRLAVIGFTRGVGRIDAMLPTNIKATVLEQRRQLLREMGTIQSDWRTKSREAQGASARAAALLAGMAANLSQAIGVVGTALAQAGRDVGSGLVDVSEGAGAAIANIGLGIGAGFGWYLLPVAAATIYAGYKYFETMKPKRARR